MGFPRREYWNGLPFPSAGDLPHPGMEPGSPALQADSLPTKPLGKSLIWVLYIISSFTDHNNLLRWQLVFLPEEFHGQRSLPAYSPCGLKESDMTKWLTLAHTSLFYKWVTCPGHRAGDKMSLVKTAPLPWTVLEIHQQTDKFLPLDFPFHGILKTQQPSVMTPCKETFSRLWYIWVTNSGLYIFYILVVFPSLCSSDVN